MITGFLNPNILPLANDEIQAWLLFDVCEQRAYAYSYI